MEIKDFIISLIILGAGVVTVTMIIGGFKSSYGPYGFSPETNFSNAFNRTNELYTITSSQADRFFNASSSGVLGTAEASREASWVYMTKVLPLSASSAREFIQWVNSEIGGFGLNVYTAVILVIILTGIIFGIIKIITNT